MQTIIAFVVFALIFISIIAMVVIYFTYKGVKKMRENAEEIYYRHQKMKEQKEMLSVKENYYAFGYVGYCYSKAAKDVIFFLPFCPFDFS